MKLRLIRIAVLAATGAVGLPVALGETSPASSEWPQFRGPGRDGYAAVQLLRAWPADGPRVLWKTGLGPGFSQIAVAGGRAFTGFAAADTEYVGAFDAGTGKEVWRRALGSTFVQEEFGNGPRSTPTVVDDVVFAFGGQGALKALAAADGAPLWEVDVTQAFGAKVPRFGYSSSPLVIDDLVVLDVGGSEQRQLVAFERKTGKVRWAAFEGPASYASPVVGELDGGRQIVHVRGSVVTGISLEGRELWQHKLEEGAIANPLILPGSRVFASSTGDTGCVMLRVRKSESGFQVEVAWKNRNMRNHFNSSIYADGYIYGFDNATLKCLSADTGEVAWAKRGLGKGSLLVSGDRLVILGDLGLLTVAERTPEAYRELGRVQLVEGSRAWTAPSVSGGRVFVRNLVEMACIDLVG